MLYGLEWEKGSSTHLCSRILPVLHLVTILREEFSLRASCWLQNQAQQLSWPHSALQLLSLALSSPLSLQCLQHILSDHAKFFLLSECTTRYVLPVPTWWMLKCNFFFYFPSEKSIRPPPCSFGPPLIALFQSPNVIIILFIFLPALPDLSWAGAISYFEENSKYQRDQGELGLLDS